MSHSIIVVNGQLLMHKNRNVYPLENRIQLLYGALGLQNVCHLGSSSEKRDPGHEILLDFGGHLLN